MLMMENTEQVTLEQLSAGLPWDWETYPEYRQSIERLPLAVNVSLFVPLNPILIYVMGVDRAKTERPTRAEMAQIKQLIHEAMDAGAQGVSLVRMGEIDSHTDFDGSAMPTDMMHPDDAAEIASVLGERQQGAAMCLTQVATMGDPEVSVTIAKAMRGQPLVHNAIVAVASEPELHREGLRWLDRQRAAGLNIWGQAGIARTWQEMTPEFMTGGSVDFLPVAREFTSLKTLDEMMAKAADPDYRHRFREGYDPRALEVFGDLSEFIVVSMGQGNDDNCEYIGLNLGQIAAMRGTDFIDAFFDVGIESGMKFTLKVPRGTVEDPIQAYEMAIHPFTLPGVSDGGAHSKFVSGSLWTTDLLIWMAREEGLMTLEELHYRLAGLPAQIFDLNDRGTIEAGKAADLVIYRLDELYCDRSSYDLAYDMPNNDWRRKVRSGGYRYVIVNGEITLERDVRTDAVPGRLLKVGKPLPERELEAAE